MGISARSASALVREAEQRIREYEMFCRWKEKNAAPVDFPLTRGELELVLFGLQGVKMSMLRGRRPVGPGAAGRGGCPTATAWCRELIRRADAALEPGQAEQEEAFRTRDPAKEFPVFLTAGGGLPGPGPRRGISIALRPRGLSLGQTTRRNFCPLGDNLLFSKGETNRGFTL